VDRRRVVSLGIAGLLSVPALQPILARARAAIPVHRFALVLDSGETIAVSVEGQDRATAAARAIRSAEHTGAHVVRLDVTAA